MSEDDTITTKCLKSKNEQYIFSNKKRDRLALIVASREKALENALSTDLNKRVFITTPAKTSAPIKSTTPPKSKSLLEALNSPKSSSYEEHFQKSTINLFVDALGITEEFSQFLLDRGFSTILELKENSKILKHILKEFSDEDVQYLFEMIDDFLKEEEINKNKAPKNKDRPNFIEIKSAKDDPTIYENEKLFNHENENPNLNVINKSRNKKPKQTSEITTKGKKGKETNNDKTNEMEQKEMFYQTKWEESTKTINGDMATNVKILYNIFFSNR